MVADCVRRSRFRTRKKIVYSKFGMCWIQNPCLFLTIRDFIVILYDMAWLRTASSGLDNMDAWKLGCTNRLC